MGKWKNRKPEAGHIQGACIICNDDKQVHRHTKDGIRYYRATCNRCHTNLHRPEFKYRSHKKSECELCGFKPVHPCQLDVDHIDGNHDNNNESNLQTLCANCHRLKTHNTKDYLTK